jgi:tetratricopeptide (TPR) repeat protein
VAECYRKAGDVEEAITTLRNAIKNDPNNMDLRLELVDALVADDRWSAADNELKRILKKEPENIGALVRSARSEETGWRPNRAQPIWRKVLALDPNHLEAQERLTELLERQGHFLMISGKTDQALECYREALAYTPDEPYLYLARADCYFDRDDLEAAREELNRAFALAPDDLDIYHSVVDLCHEQDLPDEAEWVIARAEELAGPLQPKERLPAEFYLDLADCCFKRDQTEVGDDYVQRAKQAAVDDAEGLVDVGLFYLNQDQEGQALTFFDQALRLDPGHGWANYHVGTNYAIAAEMREANRHWRQARRTARRTGDQELLEAVESIRGQFQQMITMLERGVSLEDALEVFDDESW